MGTGACKGTSGTVVVSQCKICGKRFEYVQKATGRKRKFCGCSKSRRLLHAHKCGCCGKAFKSFRADSKHCSRACQDKASGKGRRVVECIGCGTRFMPKRMACSRYCSKRCAGLTQAKREYLARRDAGAATAIADGCIKWLLSWAGCKECGTLFRKSGANLYCSEDCRRMSAGLLPRGHVLRCPDCGGDFDRRSWTHPGVRCEPCQKVAAREASNGCNAARTHQERAEAYGVPYEKFSRKRLFKRDRWKCQVCLGPVAREYKSPHPMSASIDCIVPLSKGGGFTFSNCQLAHRDCNSVKSDGI